MTKQSYSRYSIVTLFIFALMLAIQPAQAAYIDFDGSSLTEGASVTNQFSGVTFSGAVLALPGDPLIAFLSVVGSDNTLGSGAAFFNGAFLADENIGIGTPKLITATFSLLVDNVSFWAADVDGNDVLNAQAFDSSGGLLESITVNAGDTDTGDGEAFQVSFSSAGIKQIEIITTQGGEAVGWGLDSVSFTPVPVPGAVWLLGSGLAGLAGIRTTKRRKK